MCVGKTSTLCAFLYCSPLGKTRSLTNTDVTNFLDQLASKLWKNSCQCPPTPSPGFLTLVLGIWDQVLTSVKYTASPTKPSSQPSLWLSELFYFFAPRDSNLWPGTWQARNCSTELHPYWSSEHLSTFLLTLASPQCHNFTNMLGLYSLFTVCQHCNMFLTAWISWPRLQCHSCYRQGTGIEKWNGLLSQQEDRRPGKDTNWHPYCTVPCPHSIPPLFHMDCSLHNKNHIIKTN